MPQEGTCEKPCLSAMSPEHCRQLGGVLARAGDKWSMLVTVTLEHDGLRFNALRRRLGISQKVLTSTLRGLERDGYLVRSVLPGKPPPVMYHLTPLGRELLVPVRAFAWWAAGRVERIEQARALFDGRDD